MRNIIVIMCNLCTFISLVNLCSVTLHDYGDVDNDGDDEKHGACVRAYRYLVEA